MRGYEGGWMGRRDYEGARRNFYYLDKGNNFRLTKLYTLCILRLAQSIIPE